MHCVFVPTFQDKTVLMTGWHATTKDDRAVAALVVARANGDHLVHLAAHSEARSLCGHPTRVRPPHKSFRVAGCDGCLRAALADGHMAALEGDRSWINLRRLEGATT
jgi:hypothetical protein